MKKLLMLLLIAGHALGGDLRKGEVVTVKADSFWFPERQDLVTYSRVADRINSDARAAYEEALCGTRTCWQFGSAQRVRVLLYDRSYGIAWVEIIGGGSKNHFDFYIDAKDIQK